MKIGFLSHSDLSIALFRAPIMRSLKEKGHEIYAIYPKGIMDEKIKSEFNAVNYEIDKASLNPAKIVKNSLNLAKILQSLKLDMLQTSAHKSNVFGTFAAKMAGIKVVINLVEGLGSFYIENDLKSRFVRCIMEMLYKKSLNLSSACIFVNEADPKYFVNKNLIKKEKVFIVKSVGVNSAKFDPNIVKVYDFKSGKKVVLMIGRALWHKGIKEFYEAAEILNDKLKFVFVGDIYEGNKSSANRAFLENKSVEWIRWSDEIAELLKGAYMFVLPSYKEGFPRTVLEAMSMAKPCVVTNATGCNEAIKDGFNGLLCEVKNSRDLARKIEILANDEKMALEFGKNARNEVLEKYDEKIISQKYLEIYRKFISV